jgi:GxxExxY protein
LSGAIIAAAIKVHRILGAGLLEMPYRECLTYELRQRAFRVEVERAVPLVYEGLPLGLLMNFHAPTLKEGLKRVINTLQ